MILGWQSKQRHDGMLMVIFGRGEAVRVCGGSVRSEGDVTRVAVLAQGEDVWVAVLIASEGTLGGSFRCDRGDPVGCCKPGDDLWVAVVARVTIGGWGAHIYDAAWR